VVESTLGCQGVSRHGVKKAEAIRYAEDNKASTIQCLRLLAIVRKSYCHRDYLMKAYNRYALEANQGTTYLATFRRYRQKIPA